MTYDELVSFLQEVLTVPTLILSITLISEQLVKRG